MNDLLELLKIYSRKDLARLIDSRGNTITRWLVPEGKAGHRVIPSVTKTTLFLLNRYPKLSVVLEERAQARENTVWQSGTDEDE